MKKYIIPLIFFVSISFQLSPLSITPTSWNLGTITRDSGIQTLMLEALNDTPAEVKVDFISTCGCLETDTDTLELKANERASVMFTFNPVDENGEISKFMIIRTTQPGLPKALFEVTGVVSREVTENLAVLQNNNAETESGSALTESDSINKSEKVVKVKYYYSAGCSSCRKFLEETIPVLEKKLDVNIEVESLDILDSEIYKVYVSLLDEQEAKKIVFPSLLIGNRLLQGDREISENLKQAIIDYTGQETRHVPRGNVGTVSISLIPVILAGLLDGINPCVFSTLLFLISTLTLAGRHRKEILYIGIFFSLAVFITYYFVGLGLFQGLRSASVFPLIAEILKYILVFFLVLISIFSLYDFIQIKKGKTAKISLQLPKFIKLKIHSIIRGQVKSTSIIIGSLFLGVMVSIFELACTGQVYFPTIAYLVKLNQGSAFIYLAIYNISFIIPLFIVFILIYKGTGSKAITQFFQNNMGAMKIGLGLLFLFLAGVVLLL